MKTIASILETIELQETLNPKLFNENKQMKPEVRQKLVQIVEEFLDNLDVPLDFLDIELVGSNASFNYNENSDIDLHIIVNFETNYVRPDILQVLYNQLKSSFNDKYDISIEGIPVELYIQDVNSGNATNGIYSLINDEWIKEPTPIEIDPPDISEQLEEVQEECDKALFSNNPDDVRSKIDELYLNRKNGLATEGEYSVGNLVFKELRSNGTLDRLKEKYYDLRSQELSL